MSNTYTIQEKSGVFSVYRNNVFLASFFTRKEAENYIEQQELESEYKHGGYKR